MRANEKQQGLSLPVVLAVALVVAAITAGIAALLVNINEQVDPGAIEYYAHQDDVDPPPNLVEYARRKKARGKDLTIIAERTPRHPWMGNGVMPYITLALWAALAASGVLAVDLVFRVWQGWPPAWWLAAAAALFTLIDWAESCQNFAMAAGGASPARLVPSSHRQLPPMGTFSLAPRPARLSW